LSIRELTSLRLDSLGLLANYPVIVLNTTLQSCQSFPKHAIVLRNVSKQSLKSVALYILSQRPFSHQIAAAMRAVDKG